MLPERFTVGTAKGLWIALSVNTKNPRNRTAQKEYRKFYLYKNIT